MAGARVAAEQIEPIAAGQRTLRSAIHCSGIGLHSGRDITLTLRPAPVDSGIRFVRTDVAAADPVIPAKWDYVVDTTLCTVVANRAGIRVGTVEHLMAALRGCAIDNAVVELDGPEVPIMDGSAEPFVFLIDSAGCTVQSAQRRVVRVLKPVTIAEGDRSASLSPAPGSSFSFEIDFSAGAVSSQAGRVRLVNGAFKSDLARARTFGFLDQVDALRARGFALGGSLDNAIVVAEGMQISMLRGKSSREAAHEAASKTQIPLLGATVIGIMAFTGIGLSPDAAGEFLFSLFAVIGISLLLSWVLAITVTPMLAHYFFKQGKEGEVDAYGSLLFRVYGAILRWSLRFRWLVVAGLIAVTVACYAGFGLMKQQFFPDNNMS